MAKQLPIQLKGLVIESTLKVTQLLFRLAFLIAPKNRERWVGYMQDEVDFMESNTDRLYWGYSAVVFAMKQRLSGWASRSDSDVEAEPGERQADYKDLPTRT